MSMTGIYADLRAMSEYALDRAKEHRCNYNVIIHNPVNGEFVRGQSTYEMVADSYFNKERPNVKLLHKTDDVLAEKAVSTSDPLQVLNALGGWVSGDFEEDSLKLMYAGYKCTEGIYKDAHQMLSHP